MMLHSERLAVVCALLLGACFPKAAPQSPASAPGANPGGPPPIVSVMTAKDPLHARVNEAVSMIEAGGQVNLTQAVRLLDGLAVEDTSGTARFNLGVAHRALGALDRAASNAQALVAAQPDDGDAWLLLGSVQQQQGAVDAAISTFRAGIDGAPEFMPLRVALVAALRAQGQSDAAIDESKAALRVNANSLGVYNNFSLAYLDKGDTTLARFILQKALQSVEGADNNAYLHTNLGWSFYLDGNVPAATQELRRAVELDPGLVPALVYLSRVYMDDRNYGDTVPLLESAAAEAPDNADVQLNLGVAYRGVGRLAEAKTAYERALALRPAGPDPHFNLGILLGDYEKDYDGAVAAFNRYIAAGGSDRELAQTHIKAVQKEQDRAARRVKAEAERKEREEERKRKEQVLRDAEQAPAPDAPAPAPEESDPPPAELMPLSPPGQ